MGSSSTHYTIPKWGIGLYGAISLALLLVAIILPIKNKNATAPVKMIVNPIHVKRTPIPQHDIFTATDPFERFNVSAAARSAFERLSSDAHQKLGQLSQVNPQGNIEMWKERARNGEFTSMLWTLDPATIRSLQEVAVTESVSKLPLLPAFDVIHGFAVTFPVNIGLAASFSRELIYETAAAAAIEARNVGLRWAFSPMLDLIHDPRWGRMSESYGEAPFLSGELGIQHVKGFQDNGVAACVKHVGGYGAGIGGRDYNAAELSRRQLHNEYLKSYKKALVEGKALTVMASFNTIDGIPSHMNRELLTDVLRGMWGWDGLIVADWEGIANMDAHGTVENAVHSGRLALEAGVDVTMADERYSHFTEKDLKMPSSVGNGTVEDMVDIAAKRVIAVKDKLGLLQDPHDEKFKPSPDNLCKPETFKLALKAAEQSMVLLKNSQNTLPIQANSARSILENQGKIHGKSVDAENGKENSGIKILMFGHVANHDRDMLGSWAFTGTGYCFKLNGEGKKVPDITTYKEAFDKLLADKRIDEFKYLESVPGFIKPYPDPALRVLTDENSSLARTEDHSLEFSNGERMASAEDIDYSQYTHIIFVAGEHQQMNGECTSRTNLDVPELPQIKAVFSKVTSLELPPEKKPKIIEILHGARPMTTEWEDDNLDAILMAWSPGSRAGEALVNILFGDVNPSGRMPVTTPRNVGQIPIFHASQNTGRPCGDLCDKKWNGITPYRAMYIDSKSSPLYPFGFGLSYTRFDYAKPRLERTSGSESDDVVVTINVKNTGGRDGTEVVQLYVRDIVASSAPSLKVLQGFERVDLKKDEEKTVKFTLKPKDAFGFFDNEMNFLVESGTFRIYVGHDAANNDNYVDYELK